MGLSNIQRGYIGLSTDIPIESTNPILLFQNSANGISRISPQDYNYNTTVYISGSTQNSVSVGNTVTVNVPENTSSGSLMLAFITSRAQGRTFTSAGWTTERSSTLNPSQAVFSKIASDSEPSSYTFTANADPNDFGGVIVSIPNYTSYTVGTFSAQATGPTISVPDDSSYEKLILFYIGNNGSGINWNIDSILEYNVQLITAPSLQVDSIYRTSPNTSLSYTTTQNVSASNNSYGICVVVQ